MNSKRTKTLTFILVGVIVCIVSLTVVYSALSTSLTITGNVDVVASTWDVHFENGSLINQLSYDGEYKVLPLVWELEEEPSSGGTVSIVDNTTISFVVDDFNSPGDVRGVSFDVVNGGSIDAKLESIVFNGISSAQDVYLNYYIQYEDGSSPKSGDILLAGERKKVKLAVEFDKNITASQLPTEVQKLELTLSMNYVQK